MTVTIRYFAAAKAALGVGEQTLDVAGTPLGVLLADLAGRTADPTAARAVLERCSFLHNRHATTDRTIVLADGDELDVLPPFAGG